MHEYLALWEAAVAAAAGGDCGDGGSDNGDVMVAHKCLSTLAGRGFFWRSCNG